MSPSHFVSNLCQICLQYLICLKNTFRHAVVFNWNNEHKKVCTYEYCRKKCLKQSHSLDQNQQFQNSSNLIRPSCRKLRGLQIVGNWTVNKQENGNGTFTFCFKYLFVGCHWSFPLIPHYLLFIQRKFFTFRCKWNRMI